MSDFYVSSQTKGMSAGAIPSAVLKASIRAKTGSADIKKFLSSRYFLFSGLDCMIYKKSEFSWLKVVQKTQKGNTTKKIEIHHKR